MKLVPFYFPIPGRQGNVERVVFFRAESVDDINQINKGN